jgi:hypothetical protein
MLALRNMVLLVGTARCKASLLKMHYPDDTQHWYALDTSAVKECFHLLRVPDIPKVSSCNSPSFSAYCLLACLLADLMLRLCTQTELVQVGSCIAPTQPQAAAMQLHLEAARKEVAQLQTGLAATQRQREEACVQLVAERAQAAALRAEEGRIASSHRELQEAWKDMVDELKEQLKVRPLRHWSWPMMER